MSDNAQPLYEQPTRTTAAASDTHVAPTGDRFADFILLNELGRGGMGVVYRAFEPDLGRHVALKMILSGNLSGEQELARFDIEAKAAARLSHPNIVKVHRVGVHGEQHYFSMDLIEGVSLAQKLTDGPLPSKVAARYLLTIAQAIQHAHEQGILHRDIKPGNILIDTNDQPHVTDFGLAKQLTGSDKHTRTGALLGTPSYMAPEQASANKEVGPATDVYGLGALLYELLTARPPFRGETTLDTILQVLEHDAAPPRLLNPSVDRDLETICLKCLAKNPRERYPSAQELADDLRRFLDGDSIQARSLNMIDYLGRTLQRSHFDQEFRSSGNLILWFALIVGLMHVVQHFVLSQRAPFWMVGAGGIVQFALMALVVWLYRPKGFLPTTTAERLLWSVWGGYIVACTLVGHLTRLMFGMDQVYEKVVYPYNAVITGLAFIVLGSSYWGMLYAVGLAFFALAYLMQLDLYWAVLEYGAAWAATLCLIGLHLRRLGAQREHTEAKP
jgi:serine/threonine protein kinase